MCTHVVLKRVKRLAFEAADTLKPWFRRPTGGGHQGDVVRYYHECDYHYRLVAGDEESRPMHYGYYDDRARDHKRAVVRANEVLAARVGLSAADRLLDAGCGNGTSALWAARTHGAHVHGITLVDFQAERATRLATERGLAQQARFDVGDYARTGLQDDAYDVVWMQESLAHAPDQGAVLAEMARLLAPGGRIVVANIYRTQAQYAPEDEERLAHLLRGWVIPQLPTGQAFVQMLNEAGFQNIQCEDVTEHVRPDAVRMHRLSLPAYWAAQPFVRAGIYKPVEYHNVAAGWHQLPALDRGLWIYAMTTAEVAP